MSRTYKNSFPIDPEYTYFDDKPRHIVLRTLHRHYGHKRSSKWYQEFKRLDRRAVRTQHKQELIKFKQSGDRDVALRSRIVDHWYYD